MPAGGLPIERLANASTSLHPDDITAVLRAIGPEMGLHEVVVYLADLEQQQMWPLLEADGASCPPLGVDSTVAGRAYRTERHVVVPGDRDTAGRATVWFPLLDSAERFGVVHALVDEAAIDERLAEWTAVVNLVGELLANKSTYGDAVALTRRTRAMSVAAEMRWAMLPPLTFKGRNVGLSGLVMPPYEVAGDAFDYAVNGDAIHLGIVDAVGHGIESARIANLALGTYRNGRRGGSDLGEIYRRMDAIVADQFGHEKFVAVEMAELDMSSGRLAWLNAGQPQPMVVRRRHRIDLESDVHVPAGVGASGASVAEAQLEPGDVVLFFSDGVTEARSTTREEFGRDRLGDLVERAVAADQPPAETLRLLSNAVLAHQRGVLQDDATLVLLAWAGPAPAWDARNLVVPHPQ